MIQLPKDIIAKDVTQWLGDGWFYAEMKPNVFVVARLINANAEENKAYIDGLFGELAKDTEVSCGFNQLYAFWPECGALNIQPNKKHEVTGKFAVHLARLQKKQWKR